MTKKNVAFLIKVNDFIFWVRLAIVAGILVFINIFTLLYLNTKLYRPLNNVFKLNQYSVVSENIEEKIARMARMNTIVLFNFIDNNKYTNALEYFLYPYFYPLKIEGQNKEYITTFYEKVILPEKITGFFVPASVEVKKVGKQYYVATVQGISHVTTPLITLQKKVYYPIKVSLYYFYVNKCGPRLVYIKKNFLPLKDYKEESF